MDLKYAPIIAFAILAAGCGTTATTAARAPSFSAAAANAPAPVSPAVPDAATSSSPDPWQAWCYGRGFTDLQTAIGDVNPVTTDAANLDYAALATDGATLEKDALIAGANPPPESADQSAPYKSYLAWLSAAGGAYSYGQFSRAADAARQGTQYKPAVQAANDKCAAMGA